MLNALNDVCESWSCHSQLEHVTFYIRFLVEFYDKLSLKFWVEWYLLSMISNFEFRNSVCLSFAFCVPYVP